MRILWVRPRIPWPLDSGASRYSFGLLRALSQDFRITLLAPLLDADPSTAPELTACFDRLVTVVPPNRRSPLHRAAYKVASMLPGGDAPEAARYMNWALEKPLREILSTERFDVVQFEFWPTADMAGRVNTDVAKALLLHDVEYVRLARTAALTDSIREKQRLARRAATVRAFLSRVTASVDGVLTVTDADREHLTRDLGKDLTVKALPAVVDIPPDRPSARVDPAAMLFVGVMTHRPNEDAICYFCAEILDRIWARAPEAHLVIVGRHIVRSVAALAGGRVRVEGDVPSVEPFLERAAVFVAPLRTGSGVKIKILEAMAHAKAVVTTSVGAEGLGVVAGEHLEIADDPDDFARSVASLLNDPAKRRALGEAARRFITSRHSAQAAGSVAREVYHELIGAKRSETS